MNEFGMSDGIKGNLAGALEKGIVIYYTKDGKADEFKLLSLHQFVDSADKADASYRKAGMTLFYMAVKQFLCENINSIKCILINMNLTALDYKRTDYLGFEIWQKIHEYIYDFRSKEASNKNNTALQPHYCFFSFLTKHFFNCDQKPFVFEEQLGVSLHPYPIENFDIEKYSMPHMLIAPGAYLLYAGHKLLGNSHKLPENIGSICYIDDHGAEWEEVFTILFNTKVNCLIISDEMIKKGVPIPEINAECVLLDYYLNESHRDTLLLGEEQVLGISGAKVASLIPGSIKKIIFTESSKISYYKILVKELQIDGWTTKPRVFGVYFHQNAKRFYDDFVITFKYAYST